MPGWKVLLAEEFDKVGITEPHHGSRSQLIAICYTRNLAFDEPTQADRDEMLANARLIAAAPDLLAACKMALDRIPPVRGPGADSDAVDACILAIAKAEGK